MADVSLLLVTQKISKVPRLACNYAVRQSYYRHGEFQKLETSALVRLSHKSTKLAAVYTKLYADIYK